LACETVRLVGELTLATSTTAAAALLLHVLGALAGALVGAPVFAGDKPAKAPVEDGSKVVITSPKDGDEVDDTFELKYELTKGSQATHVHVYVDGEYQKGFSGTLKGLSKGDRKITVAGATKDHDLVVATHTIIIEVE